MKPSLPIAVVIPAYNASEHLAGAVETIRNQTVEVAEIIVVDDGSRDDTSEVARALGVTALRQENAGCGPARNTGIWHASAPWIALLDADDRWEPQKLERQWTAHELEPETRLISCDTVMYAGDRLYLASIFKDSKNYPHTPKTRLAPGIVLISSAALSVSLPVGQFLAPSTVLAARSLFTDGYFFSHPPSKPRYHVSEDLEWYLRALKATDVLVVEETLMRYATGAPSLSSNAGRMHYGVRKLAEMVAAEPERYAERVSAGFERDRRSRETLAVMAFLRAMDPDGALDALADFRARRRSLRLDALVLLAIVVRLPFVRPAVNSLRTLWRSRPPVTGGVASPNPSARRPYLPTRREWGAVLVVALLQAACMFWLGAQLGTSRDEEYALATTAHGVAYAFHRALTYELQAPLYFVLCAMWREANPSMLFARALSVVTTFATTMTVAAIAKHVRPTLRPWTFAAAFAISPMAIYSAVDIRSYSLAMLFLALATLAFLSGWFRDGGTRARLLFAILAILGIATQYYVAFLVAGAAVGLLASGRFRAFRSFVVYAGAVGAATALFVVLAAHQISSYDFTPHPLGAAVRDVLSEPVILFAVPWQGFHGYGRAYAAVLAATFFALALGRVDLRAPAVRMTLGTIAGTYACYVLATVALHVYFSPPRHYFVFVIPILAFGAVAFGAMDPRFRMLSARAVAGAYVATALSAAWYSYHGLAKDGDWKRVGAYVSAHVRPGDRVAVFEPDAVPAFARFYTADVPVEPFPHAVDPNRYDPDALVIHSDAEARAALRQLAAGGAHVWLAIDCAYHDPLPHEGCDLLTAAIDDLYPDRGRTDFHVAWLAELPKRAP